MAEAAPILPYGRQLIDDDDIAAVTAVLRSDMLTTGPAVERFERALAERVDARHAVVCSSGTAALHLAALAAGLTAGDVAMVPTVTFLATANAARYVGAEVGFTDVEPDSGLMRIGDLEAALQRTDARSVKAILPVHLTGQCADLPEIARLADRLGAVVIEDACHAIGTHYADGNESIPVGACRHSDMCVFSFHPVKTIAMGEGGAITTNDDVLAERLRRYRTIGMQRDSSRFSDPDGADRPWWYEMPELGFNYRASDIHCALALSQMGKLDRFIATRRALAARYDDRLRGLAPRVAPLARIETCEPVWHIYVVLIDFAGLERNRADVMRALRERGIGTQVHYIPVSRQPYYRQRYGDIELPGADRYYERALTLPLHAGMDVGDVDRVVDVLGDVLDDVLGRA